MCSIVVFRDIWTDSALLICANRDESYDRPSQGLRTRQRGDRTLTSPLDQQAGGTWIGTNDLGLFVGLTNRFSGPHDPKRRSRGELVERTLMCHDADSAISSAFATPPSHYNPCHLVVATTEDIRVLVNTGDSWREMETDSHQAIVTERSFEAGHTTRDGRIKKAIQPWLDAAKAPTNRNIQDVMSIHATPTFEGICVHWDERRYGTRSLTIIRQPNGDVLRHFSTEGAPCSTPLRVFDGVIE